MNIREALEALGVRSTTLSDAEKEHLDHDGYLPLPGSHPRALVDRGRRRVIPEWLCAEYGEVPSPV